jgi:hypothetical protein
MGLALTWTLSVHDAFGFSSDTNLVVLMERF